MHYEAAHNYKEAQDICKIEGARLANPFGSYNWSALGGYIERSRNGALGNWVKFDGSDVAEEGIWIMTDGTVHNVADKDLPNSGQFWAPGEPAGNRTENCLAFFSINNGVGDLSCDSDTYKEGDMFLCELAAP
jgi:hypothetical protein